MNRAEVEGLIAEFRSGVCYSSFDRIVRILEALLSLAYVGEGEETWKQIAEEHLAGKDMQPHPLEAQLASVTAERDALRECAAAFDAVLSTDCDCEERDALRVALAGKGEA